jgi:hypothetical protein
VNKKNIIKRIPGMGQYLGGESRQKLLYVSDADNKPVGDKHEISDSELFQFLLDEAAEAETIQMPEILKDVDKNWKIVEFETHQSRKKNKSTRHVFVVFKTTSIFSLRPSAKSLFFFHNWIE